MALGQLVQGKWTSKGEQEDSQGNFLRPSTAFRDRITADGSSGFKAESGRYHLYISWAFPWAHRTAIMRKLKGLEDVISLSVVDPIMGEEGWAFSDYPSSIPDSVNGTKYLRDDYLKADPKFTRRDTVPILWIKKLTKLLINESRNIIKMLNTGFVDFVKNIFNFYPENLQSKREEIIDCNL